MIKNYLTFINEMNIPEDSIPNQEKTSTDSVETLILYIKNHSTNFSETKLFILYYYVIQALLLKWGSAMDNNIPIYQQNNLPVIKKSINYNLGVDMDYMSETEIEYCDLVILKYDKLSITDLKFKYSEEGHSDGVLSFLDIARTGGASEDLLYHIQRWLDDNDFFNNLIKK